MKRQTKSCGSKRKERFDATLRQAVRPIAVVILSLACACGKRDARSPESGQTKADPTAVGAAAAGVIAGQLAACLPQALAGMTRSELIADGQNYAMAKSTYKTAEGGLIEITISEIQQPSKLANMVGADWVTTQFERETDDEYERSILRDGVPVYEAYSRSRKHGLLKTPFDKRWLIEITGYGVGPELLRGALKEINAERLRKLPAQTVNGANRPKAAAVRPDRTVPAPPPSPAPASHKAGSDRANKGSPR